MKKSRKKPARSRSKTTPAAPDGDFALRLRAAREERRLSQSELERITGISQAVIANYEAGRYRPGFREMFKLCEALRVTPNVFFYGKDDPFSQRDLTSDVGTGFRLWEGDAPPSAELVEATMRGTVYLIALNAGDRRAVFDIVQSLVRKKVKPADLAKLEEFVAGFAGAFVKRRPELEHEFETIARDPSLKRFTGKPRRPK